MKSQESNLLRTALTDYLRISLTFYPIHRFIPTKKEKQQFNLTFELWTLKEKIAVSQKCKKRLSSAGLFIEANQEPRCDAVHVFKKPPSLIFRSLASKETKHSGRASIFTNGPSPIFEKFILFIILLPKRKIGFLRYSECPLMSPY